MIKISQIKYEYLPEMLKNGIEKNEALAEIELVIKTICNCSSKDIVLDFSILEKNEQKIRTILNERIVSRKPIQQILGFSYFLSEKFYVNENTLIPRPETELLVEEAVLLLKQINNPKVLDIGTGSGNIACMIAEYVPDVEVIGVDISTKALQVAIKNAENIGVIKKAMFRKSDIFSNISEKFDMIVSNPPYIPRKDKETLQPEVKDYEPEQALFADDDCGLTFYKRIISGAKKYLKPNGFLAFELGVNQAGSVQKLLLTNGFKSVKLLKDFNNIERVIIAQVD